MKIENPTEETSLRIRVAKEYMDLVKEKMGKWFITAYIFGSTSRNEAKETSDVDIIFLFKKPSPKQKCFINSIKGGLFDKNRNGIINGTFNEHYASLYMDELYRKYNIFISRYYHYGQNGEDYPIWLCEGVRIPFSILTKTALEYQKDF